MRNILVLLVVAFLWTATVVAQEKVFVPVTIGAAREDRLAEPSTEQVLRVTLLNRGVNTESSVLSVFNSGPRSPLVDFGDGQWCTGELLEVQILGKEEATFFIKNSVDGLGSLPVEMLEDFLLVAKVGPNTSIYAWLEVRDVATKRLVERRLVAQPSLASSKDSVLPVSVTNDENTTVFLSNPSYETVVVGLDVTNSFEYRNSVPGPQGEKTTSSRVFHSAITLEPLETKSFKVSTIFKVQVEDVRGNALSRGILRVSSSSSILTKIE